MIQLVMIKAIKKDSFNDCENFNDHLFSQKLFKKNVCQYDVFFDFVSIV